MLAGLVAALLLATPPAASCEALRGVQEWSGSFTYTLRGTARVGVPGGPTIVTTYAWSAEGQVHLRPRVDDGEPQPWSWRGTGLPFDLHAEEQTTYENVLPEGENVLTRRSGRRAEDRNEANLRFNCAKGTYWFGVHVGDVELDQQMTIAPAMVEKCGPTLADLAVGSEQERAIKAMGALPCLLPVGAKKRYDAEHPKLSFSTRVEQEPLPAGGRTLTGTRAVKTNHGELERAGIVGELTWTLSPGPPAPKRREPVILVRSADGRTCGCNGRPVELTATSSEPGGTFEPFLVRARGKGRPVVDRNVGGAAPALALHGDARTVGPVEVVARWRKGGKIHESAPFPVSFCEVERPELRSNTYAKEGADGPHRRRYLFSTSTPASLEIDALSRAWIDGAEANEELRWLVSGNDDGWIEAKDGRATVLKVHGLPRSNGRLGPHKIRNRVERCDCEGESAEAVLFFPVDKGTTKSDGMRRRWATNNPDGGPNWLHYWSQTRAGITETGAFFTFRYLDRIGPAKFGDRIAEKLAPGLYLVQARYEPAEEAILLSHMVASCDCFTRPDGHIDQDLDCLAVLLRHESCHGRLYQERVAICRGVVGCDPTLPGANEEDTCYAAGWTWTPGSAAGQDWSDVGKAWTDP